MRHCWEQCRKFDRAEVRWGQTGPQLVARGLEQMPFAARLLPPDAFYPVDFFRFHRLVHDAQLPEHAHSLHLWNSRWRREGLDPDARYRPDCIYERLKHKHQIHSPAGAPRGDAGMLGRSPHFVRKFVTKLGRFRRSRRPVAHLSA